MNGVSFSHLGTIPASTIPGSKGKEHERLSASCFPKNDARFYFRCETSNGDFELAPLHPKPLPGRATKCCKSNMPKFIELTLKVDGAAKRMKINLRSFAKRCGVTKEELYDACAEDRLFELLEDRGLPIKWHTLLAPTLLSMEIRNSVVGFIKANFRDWKQRCEQDNLASIFIRAKHPVRCDVEYFQGGDIYVCFVEMGQEKQIGLAADLSGKIDNPEWRELFDKNQFLVYQICEQRFQDTRGILRIYRTSEYPDRFNVYHERYKHSLDELIGVEAPPELESKSNGTPPLHKRKGSSSPSRFQPRRAGSSKSFKKDGSLGKTKPLSLKGKIKIACDALYGLDVLHRNKIVHLNLTPSCIFLQPERAYEPPLAVLGRFEEARVVGKDADSQFITIRMRRPYLAPELQQNDLYQNQIALTAELYPADVYSLGGIFKYLFEVGSLDVAVVPNDSSPKDLIRMIVSRMLASDPNMRYTAKQAYDAFVAIKL